ncbi:hypothetical protein OOK43_31995 [[Kitasatospora] papulosa]|uniref:hypothetical protein n=1 Tax=Streptomyces TaxID=1883 RepID=UPI0022538D6B|nr:MULTISPECIES: hypothetical protein [Streptomyces]MCX4417860.1 hypothetical protein [[Kitasatospora] papulosa]MCY1677071.1 hypothetical protein [Streptomyces sp. SL294]
MAADGTVTAADVPAILRNRRVWAGLISELHGTPARSRRQSRWIDGAQHTRRRWRGMVTTRRYDLRPL